MELKYFYKIENDRLIKGSGFKIPENCIEYNKKNPPVEFIELQNKINKIKEFENKFKELKKNRDLKVGSIVVELSTGEKLNGDELSQTRLSRALNGLIDDEEISWIDSKNETIKLNKDKIIKALRLAGEQQTSIFVEYNNLRNKLNEEYKNVKV